MPRPSSKRLPEGLAILYEDRDILVVDKPPGLLTIGTDKEESRTAYFALTDYVRKGNPKARKRIFIVHRLDREASGILVFARTEEAKRRLQDGWQDATKKYLAVVHGSMPEREGTIVSHLRETEALRVYSTPDPSQGKLSRTAYRVLKETRVFSLLEVDLLTGRKHQIRVHLAESGHPIVGDKKYGPRDPAHPRMALHALSLAFPHPFHGRPCAFATPTPAYFRVLVGEWGEAR